MDFDAIQMQPKLYSNKWFLAKLFKLSRSMRQGCPIASYLYVLQAEKIRNSNKIKGITIPTESNTKNC